MIHILQSGLKDTSQDEHVLALFNAIIDAGFDVKIEIFSKCKNDIYKWTGDVVFLVNSTNKSELNDMIANLCVCVKLAIYLVNTTPDLDFKNAVEARFLQRLEQRQSNAFRVSLLVPALTCLKTYAKGIFEANIPVVAMRLHSLIRHNLKRYAYLTNEAKTVSCRIYLTNYDKKLNKFSIVYCHIEPFAKQGILSAFNMQTYNARFASLRLIRKPVSMPDDAFADLYSDEHKHTLAIRQLVEAFDNEHALFMAELKHLCTIFI